MTTVVIAESIAFLAAPDAAAGRLAGVPSRAGRRLRIGGADRDERAWIRAAQDGSEEALERLFRRHWRMAHRTAYLIVHDGAAAEDIAQEAFLSAVRALHRFDRSRAFGPWLNRIVVNRAIDWARTRALRREVADDGLAEAADAQTRSAAYSDELMAALAALSPEHRAVVVLRYLLEYTPGEIAGLLELPRGTVNSRLRRALDGLEAGLEDRPS